MIPTRDTVETLLNGVFSGLAVKLGVELEVLAPAMVADAFYTSQPATADWSNPTVAGTTRGILFPAGERAQRTAGLIGKHVTHEAYLEPVTPETVTLAPEGRVRLGMATYRIQYVEAWSVFTMVLLEVLDG